MSSLVHIQSQMNKISECFKDYLKDVSFLMQIYAENIFEHRRFPIFFENKYSEFKIKTTYLGIFNRTKLSVSHPDKLAVPLTLAALVTRFQMLWD